MIKESDELVRIVATIVHNASRRKAKEEAAKRERRREKSNRLARSDV
jgi:hypothetical protein